ncbi:MAG TPA: hypothetical protein QGF58_08285 [Myxococcota bacterium]|nr:hypothetical protein [Myxococcota bacterium]
MTLLTILTACNTSNPVEGIWVFTASPDGLQTKTDATCEENFHYAHCPASEEIVDSEWTGTTDTVVDDDPFIAQITGQAPGEAYLFVNGQIMEGEKNDKGKWVFTVTDLVEIEDYNEHESGYHNSEYQRDTRTLKLIVSQEGNTLDGHLEETWRTEASWTVSDEWDAADVGYYTSTVPASSYLAGDEPWSTPEDDDCEGPDCYLGIMSTISHRVPVFGQLTDLDKGEDFEGVDGYGDWEWQMEVSADE